MHVSFKSSLCKIIYQLKQHNKALHFGRIKTSILATVKQVYRIIPLFLGGHQHGISDNPIDGVLMKSHLTIVMALHFFCKQTLKSSLKKKLKSSPK